MRRMKTAAVCAAAALLAFTTFNLAADAPAPAAATGTVTGTVRGQDGKPAANATVKLTELKSFTPDKPVKTTADAPAKPENKADKAKKKGKTLTATTDDKGQFKIENVPAGQYTVSASIKDAGKGKSSVLVKAGETTDVTLSLHAGKSS